MYKRTLAYARWLQINTIVDRAAYICTTWTHVRVNLYKIV